MHKFKFKPSFIINNFTPFLTVSQKKLIKYAYHFTDVNNAANILNDGTIFSRKLADFFGRMNSDNAAKSVISGTDENTQSFVRFYFRPKTPTQYRNEGIRSIDELHSELKAHCPIPVFFLFDIDKILNKPETQFTYESMASHHDVETYNFKKDYGKFLSAPFQHIYHFNPIRADEDKQLIRKRRHAEILIKDSCDLSALKHIYCRNENEASTLKSLLSSSAFEKYKELIEVPPNVEDFFYDNYLTVKSVHFEDKMLYINWNTTNQLSEFNFKFEINTLDDKKVICHGKSDNYNPYIQTERTYRWETHKFLTDYDDCKVKIFLDNNLVYMGEHKLNCSEKETEQGHAEAQYKMGLRYLKDQCNEEAFKCFMKAADQGHASAQCNLGYCYNCGKGVEPDYEEGVRWYRKAADQGHAQAQFNLGYCYNCGKGVEPDAEEAVRWYRKAADQGHAQAQCNLGLYYENGNGVEQDAEEAAEWYRKAADQGHAQAQCNLGLCYENGNGVEQDAEEAVEWYRKASEQGHATAQNNLGNSYARGKGVEQDHLKAAEWLRKAADQGHADAQNNLGLLYATGKGVEQNHLKAAEWLRKAANQGHANAKDIFSILYATGKGESKTI